MIVHATTELLGPKPAMDKPLLVPSCLTCGASGSSDKIQNVRGAKCKETDLRCRGQVRVGLVQGRRPKTEQDQAGIHVTLVKEVAMQPLAQIAALAYIASPGVDRIGDRRRHAILDAQPVRVQGHEVVAG